MSYFLKLYLWINVFLKEKPYPVQYNGKHFLWAIHGQRYKELINCKLCKILLITININYKNNYENWMVVILRTILKASQFVWIHFCDRASLPRASQWILVFWKKGTQEIPRKYWIMKIIEANIYWTPSENLGLLNDLHASFNFILTRRWYYHCLHLLQMKKSRSRENK